MGLTALKREMEEVMTVKMANFYIMEDVYQNAPQVLTSFKIHAQIVLKIVENVLLLLTVLYANMATISTKKNVFLNALKAISVIHSLMIVNLVWIIVLNVKIHIHVINVWKTM